jgi:hypothetical protein
LILSLSIGTNEDLIGLYIFFYIYDVL